jgi:hypothetical protein
MVKTWKSHGRCKRKGEERRGEERKSISRKFGFLRYFTNLGKFTNKFGRT